MSFFDAFNTSASGLTAQRLRMDVISENIANVETTRTASGGPYKRKIALFQEIKNNTPFEAYFNSSLSGSNNSKGVKVSKIVEDETEGIRVYEPNHPDADDEGYFTKPNVNVVEEMVNMISSSRSYEANVTSMGITKSMISKTLEISR